MSDREFDAVCERCENMRIPVSLGADDDRAFPLIFVNSAFEKLTGYDRSELLGKSCRVLQGRKSDAAVSAHIRKQIEAGLGVCSIILNYRKSGEAFQNFLIIEPLQLASQRTLLIGFQYEIANHTQRADLSKHIRSVMTQHEELNRSEMLFHDQMLTALRQRSDAGMLALKLLANHGR